jgi:hypothetical protein
VRRLLPVCVLTSLVAIGGCTGSSNAPRTSPPSPVTTSPSPTSSPSPSPTESASATPTVTPSVAASPTASAGAAAPACPTSALRLSAGRGGAAAGTYYLSLVFTNTGGTTCSLRGFPGASFVDATGGQLGLPADRSAGEPMHRVVLASGAKAHALLGIPETANFSRSDCQPRHAAGVRAYPPEQTQSLVVRIKLTVCTTKNGRSLVQAIKPGTHG